MSLLPINGRARVFADDINTDYIISSHRKKETIDPQVLKQYLLEDAQPGFARTLGKSDILVAGKNFGCGSAMEVAVTVVLAAGIRAVVAQSFSRTYLRNALNNGLMPVVADTRTIVEGAPLSLRLDEQGRLLLEHGQAEPIVCEPLPAFVLSMLQAGGLVAYLKDQGSLLAS
ncbi:alpha-IPM isomerase [Pseudomonas agarici]|uniref:Alpha-IPM isomerase n=1 Tax=Pseudomonas agarici TaxID=46677 RepID=A0A0X1T3M8_PSEAA|nr:alpha-IPM isomerase [Pseudomonas agarici]AMB86707.1 alpha-IPM isomerase [Pseudomonas agarici]NWB93970.1 alpha-IPM isomerase [Pseudomonas agarici]